MTGNEFYRVAVARFQVARIMLPVLFVILARVKPPGRLELVGAVKGQAIDLGTVIDYPSPVRAELNEK